jgi:ATP-dependent Clp protease protease subunit
MIHPMDKENELRTLTLSDSVDEDSVGYVVDKIFEINREDELFERKLTDYERKPITLVISSYGGDVYSGLALIGAIEMSKTPVITVALGKAMSMGLFIFLAGHIRITHRFTKFMWHEVSTGVEGPLQYLRHNLEETKNLQDQLDAYFLERTGQPEEFLDQKEKLLDWFMSAEEAVDIGIAHKFVEKPEIDIEFVEEECDCDECVTEREGETKPKKEKKSNGKVSKDRKRKSVQKK